MSAYDHIAIIYNPGSSGDAPSMANELADQIKNHKKKIGCIATLTPTKHAKHAIKLSRDISLKYKRPLIISVSGDGGYNEVINGAMQAKEKSAKARPITAVAAAGNANDHRRVMRDRPLIDLILEESFRPFDLIRLTGKAKEFEVSRYAHSYIGFGVTPQVGHELNKHGKSLWYEIKTILKTYRTYAPFEIKRNGKKIGLDNLVFANINEMAKFIKLDDVNDVHDGKFEVIALGHRSKLSMLGTLLKAAVIGFSGAPSYHTYELETLKALPIQLDGEIERLPKNCVVVVEAIPDAIESLF